MRPRARVLATIGTLFLTLLSSVPSASALSMLVKSSVVTVDTFARAETNIQDAPPESGESLKLGISEALFIDRFSAVAVAVAESKRLPPLSEPVQMETSVDLDVSTRTGGELTAAASAFGGGMVEFEVRGAPLPGDPQVGVIFEFDLDITLDDGDEPWSVSYSIATASDGTLFSFSGQSVPEDPIGFAVDIGETFFVDWTADIGAAAESGDRDRAELTFDSLIRVVPVNDLPEFPIPEPGTHWLLGIGLLMLARQLSGRRAG